MTRLVAKEDVELVKLINDMDKICDLNSKEVSKAVSNLVKTVRQCFSRKEYRSLPLDAVMPHPVHEAFLIYAQRQEAYSGLNLLGEPTKKDPYKWEVAETAQIFPGG